MMINQIGKSELPLAVDDDEDDDYDEHSNADTFFIT